MTLEIIRHGLTLLQEEHRYQGRTDAELSENGRTMLKPAENCPELLCVSPLRRARETASVLYPGMQQIIMSGLEEMDFGIFEGKSASEMKNNRDYRKWVDSGCTDVCPGGESKEKFCKRTISAFEKILKDAVQQKINSVVIVAHSGTQMAIMEHFCTDKKPYFDWHLASGMGYLCRYEISHQIPELKLICVTNHNRS